MKPEVIGIGGNGGRARPACGFAQPELAGRQPATRGGGSA